MGKNKFFLTLSLIMNFVFMALLLYIVYKEGYINFKKLMNGTPAHRTISHHYIERQSLFEVLPDIKDAIVFIGSSKTEYCEWAELFQNSKIINRGIGSDTSKGILMRISEIMDSSPAKIFIMIGATDLGANVAISQIVENYEEIIKKIKIRSPETLVYLQSVLPRNYNKLIRKSNVVDFNTKVLILNQKLRHLCDKYGIQYIDYWPLLVVDNQLNPAYTMDGIHLFGEAYLQIKNVLKEYVCDNN